MDMDVEEEEVHGEKRQCPNSEIFCGSKEVPVCMLQIHGGLCLYCNVTIGCKIETQHASSSSVCSVCLESTHDQLVRPKQCPAGHAFCVPCIFATAEAASAVCPVCKDPFYSLTSYDENGKNGKRKGEDLCCELVPLWDEETNHV